MENEGRGNEEIRTDKNVRRYKLADRNDLPHQNWGGQGAGSYGFHLRLEGFRLAGSSLAQDDGGDFGFEILDFRGSDRDGAMARRGTR